MKGSSEPFCQLHRVWPRVRERELLFCRATANKGGQNVSSDFGEQKLLWSASSKTHFWTPLKWGWSGRCPLLVREITGCRFFAYSWRLPAYTGAFLLTIDNFSFFTYSWSFFAYGFSFFTHNWSFFAYSGKMPLIGALRDCKQRSLTVSEKAPTVSKKASPEITGASPLLVRGKMYYSWGSKNAIGEGSYGVFAPCLRFFHPPYRSLIL